MEGIVKLAFHRFQLDEDEANQEEFRQLLKSYQRFYAFIAQVSVLNDPWLEKLYVYVSWLSKLIGTRDVPADISVTDDMLTLSAFRLEKGEVGSASLTAGETSQLPPITEFGANTPTEEEEKSLSEIIGAFNERYGANIREEDLLMVHQAADKTNDAEMMELINNNPADVAEGAWNKDMRQNLIQTIVRNNELNSILLNDGDLLAKVVAYSFQRALRQAKGASQSS